MTDYSDRHPSTQHMMQMLTPNPNLPPNLGAMAQATYRFAEQFVDALPDSPEITAGLRKLLEAKDCFIRAAVFGQTVDYRDR